MSNRFTKYTADKLRADGWLDKEQADALRTRLQQVESERDKAEAELKTALAYVTSGNTTISDLESRIVEADWIIRNSVATDTFTATRRDTFLNM